MKPRNTEPMQAERTFHLPKVITNLVKAREAMREHYRAAHGDRLSFTFDGNLVGDIGEALAVEYYGVQLSHRGGPGVDGLASDKTTVQVKATGTDRGAAFRDTEVHAHRLLFFSIDFANCRATVIYNGLEAPIRKLLNPPWQGQKAVSMRQMRVLGKSVRYEDRLPEI